MQQGPKKKKPNGKAVLFEVLAVKTAPCNESQEMRNGALERARFMLRQGRENDRLMIMRNYFIISLWNTGMYRTVLLLSCQHVWKEIGVRVYQTVLTLTPYQSFYVVHQSGEDTKWNSFQHLRKHHEITQEQINNKLYFYCCIYLPNLFQFNTQNPSSKLLLLASHADLSKVESILFQCAALATRKRNIAVRRHGPIPECQYKRYFTHKLRTMILLSCRAHISEHLFTPGCITESVEFWWDYTITKFT